MILIRYTAVVMLALCTAFAAGVSANAVAERPNILFIYTDDHSYRSVSCYPEAYDWVHTPNINRLAEQGVRFTHAYIGTWCMPSRATLLTGHLQYGVESMRMVGRYPGSEYDPQQCPFWPKVFRRHGYVTAQIGKWHTGTFFHFAGIALPWRMHGHDLSPLLKGPQAEWKHPVLLTLTGMRYGSDTNVVPTDPEERDMNGVPWWVFLVRGRYKYIRTLVEGEIEELYDLRNDPEELSVLKAGRTEVRRQDKRWRDDSGRHRRPTGPLASSSREP